MRERAWLSLLIYLSNNLISLVGVVAVTVGGVSWLLVLPVTLGGSSTPDLIGRSLPF